MKPVPSITINAPLKIDEVKEEYQEGSVEKRGRTIFIFGIIFSLLILFSTWVIFAFWFNSAS